MPTGLLVRRAWPAVAPHTHLVAGLYFGLMIMAGLGGMGILQEGLASWGVAWWQRRQGDRPLSAQSETLIILIAFTLIWMMTLTMVLRLARAFPA